MPASSPRLAAALDRLISGSRTDPPHAYATTVISAASLLGSSDTTLYVQDYAQQVLRQVDGDDELPIEGSAAGEAFCRTTTVAVRDDDGVRLWVPLRDGSERLGVIALVFPTVDAEIRRITERFSAVAAEMMISRGHLTDVFARLRRRHDMALAAEMQWELLPPLSFSTADLSVAGVLEPAYTVGGDVFDYAHDDLLRLAVLDAMGHGVHAALTASLAVNAYRHARRQSCSLEDTYHDIDAAISEYRPAGFVTGVLGELDPRNGVLRWINAGHPPPRILRGGSRLDPTIPVASTPFGLGQASGLPDIGAPAVVEATLEPNDVVALLTDGVIEQQNADGVPFGEDRLIAQVASHAADGLPLEESLRQIVADLLAYSEQHLRDDATLLLVSYHPDA